MAIRQSNTDLILRILEDQEERTLEDEEIVHLLLDKKLSCNTAAEHTKSSSFSGRAADTIARFVGSWTFITIFLVSLLGWIALNALLLAKAVDPFPYILLNLILSCVAAIQAPVIMMSQNRQEEKDRLRSLNDYKTNLKTEIIIEELYEKIETIGANQETLMRELERIQALDAITLDAQPQGQENNGG